MLVFLEFIGDVEAELWKVTLRHLEDVVGVGQEYVAAVAVNCHELVFAFFERCERVLVVALNPACFV